MMVASLASKIFPKVIFRFPAEKNSVFLTFDDGPHPEITPLVLDMLRKFGAKATFFCIGKHIEKHPEIFLQLISEGHAIGNHTYDHLNGWKTSSEKYFENVEKCNRQLLNPALWDEALLRNAAKDKTHCVGRSPKSLFRPPYGKITVSQYLKISRQYKIILWDIMSNDYDKKITKEKCLERVVKKIKGGSIIVFHDSEKASHNLLYVLPRVLEFCTGKKYLLKAV